MHVWVSPIQAGCKKPILGQQVGTMTASLRRMVLVVIDHNTTDTGWPFLVQAHVLALCAVVAEPCSQLYNRQEIASVAYAGVVAVESFCSAIT
jgi:hypothetical protein